MEGPAISEDASENGATNATKSVSEQPTTGPRRSERAKNDGIITKDDVGLVVVPHGGRIESVEGLVSIDRSVVAALLSTTPRA